MAQFVVAEAGYLATFSVGALLNELTHQYHIGSASTFSIHLTNRSKYYVLSNPQVYMYPNWGHCFNPPQPTVLPGLTEICSFTNSSGIAGVLTYDFRDERLAIMFTTYACNRQKCRFALRLLKPEEACDKPLYDNMYEGHEFMKADGSETICASQTCGVKGTVTTMNKSVMKIEIWDV